MQAKGLMGNWLRSRWLRVCRNPMAASGRPWNMVHVKWPEGKFMPGFPLEIVHAYANVDKSMSTCSTGHVHAGAHPQLRFPKMAILHTCLTAIPTQVGATVLVTETQQRTSVRGCGSDPKPRGFGRG